MSDYKKGLLDADVEHVPAVMVVDARRKKRSKLGQAALAALGVAALTTYYYFPQAQNLCQRQSPAAAEVCTTASCVHIASDLLKNLSPEYKELDPCTNFEEMVCGGWRQHHDLRPDQGDAFTGTYMAENGQTMLRHILEASYPAKSQGGVDKDNFNKMKAAYDACIDEDAIKKLGLKPLRDLLGQVDGAFTKGIAETVLLLHRLDQSALVAVGTGADDKDPDTVVVSVSAPYSIGLPSKERYEDKELVEKYRSVIIDILSTLFGRDDSKNYDGVVDFEKKLAAISPSSEQRGDVEYTYNPMSVSELEKKLPQLGLGDLISSLSPKGVKVDRVIITSPDYVNDLAKVLSDTPREVVGNYFRWKVVQSFASYVEDDALKGYQRFRNELAGKEPDSKPERWRVCVNHVDGGLGWILSRFFVESAFSPEARDFGNDIVHGIKKQFVHKLKTVDWMDEVTSKLAIDKVHNIVQKIGYPSKSPDILDPKDLSKYYERVNVSSKSFFENVVSMRGFDSDQEWETLGKPVDRNTWGMTASTVNAYYNPPGNEIVFPAGIMQFPVFDVEAPAYVSYGAFGSVAGHELSHAFDSTGRHYDQNGNFTDWWTPGTVDAFKKRAECFVDQYSKFSIKGPDGKDLHVNGRLTLGENIADAGGLSAAYHAWKSFEDTLPKEVRSKMLPGLEHFTQDQLFFVSYGNWWCGKSTPNAAVSRIYTDPHAPVWSRVLGTMANSREFRESFQCPVKKPTCELW